MIMIKIQDDDEKKIKEKKIIQHFNETTKKNIDLFYFAQKKTTHDLKKCLQYYI